MRQEEAGRRRLKLRWKDSVKSDLQRAEVNSQEWERMTEYHNGCKTKLLLLKKKHYLAYCINNCSVALEFHSYITSNHFS